jgi:uncharacterized protein YhjY with autotransporter beta-barrel domain
LAPSVPVLAQVCGSGSTPDPHRCNITTAPKTFGAQATMMLPASADLAGAIMGRIDSERAKSKDDASASGSPGNDDGMMGLGKSSKTVKSAPQGPFSIFAAAALLGGTNPDSPSLAGYSYDTLSAVLGLEYTVNRTLILGLAGSVTDTGTDLNTGATVGVSSAQVAAYLSYATKQVFLDALVAYGASDLAVRRPVIAQVVRSSTDANALLAVIRGGYLFDLGKLRVGPIAGLTYVHGRIDGYTETGAPDLVYTVSTQSFDLLTGSAGVRFLAAFQASGYLVVPYLNVTWEHQLGDSTQSFSATLVQPGALPISLSYPVFDARDFGKIEGGVTIELAPWTTLMLGGASTFASDGHDFRVSAGLSFRF